MEQRIAVNTARLARENIEGPSRRQATKMRGLRRRYLAAAAAALEAGNDDRAFDLDCMAFDIETTLRTFGESI